MRISGSFLALAIISFVVLGTSSGADGFWDDFDARMKAFDDRMKAHKDDIKSSVERVSANTVAVWVGHGTILRMSKTGSFQSGISKDTSRIGVTPPEGAIDMTANIAEGSCDTITVLGNIKITACGKSNGCKTIATAKSTAKICGNSVSTSGV